MKEPLVSLELAQLLKELRWEFIIGHKNHL